VVGVLAIGRKVHRFKPGRGRWIFKGDKHPQRTFLRRAVNPSDHDGRFYDMLKNPKNYERDIS
jgi:hypothetical protein